MNALFLFAKFDVAAVVKQYKRGDDDGRAFSYRRMQNTKQRNRELRIAARKKSHFAPMHSRITVSEVLVLTARHRRPNDLLEKQGMALPSIHGVTKNKRQRTDLGWWSFARCYRLGHTEVRNVDFALLF